LFIGGAHISAMSLVFIHSIWFGYIARLPQWGGKGSFTYSYDFYLEEGEGGVSTLWWSSNKLCWSKSVNKIYVLHFLGPLCYSEICFHTRPDASALGSSLVHCYNIVPSRVDFLLLYCNLPSFRCISRVCVKTCLEVSLRHWQSFARTVCNMNRWHLENHCAKYSSPYIPELYNVQTSTSLLHFLSAVFTASVA
jgi:hypothetical protein